ncbi:MAG: hypothetical protein K0U74_01005, partial [Alphaproteobacteria bacterium]|nr:hypothetical protein [Alphaproteobacteria bacterium]
MRAVIQIIACNPVTAAATCAPTSVALAGAGAWASGGSFGDVMKAIGISFAQMAVFHYVGGILDGVGEQMAALGKATTAAGKAAFAAVKG